MCEQERCRLSHHTTCGVVVMLLTDMDVVTGYLKSERWSFDSVVHEKLRMTSRLGVRTCPISFIEPSGQLYKNTNDLMDFSIGCSHHRLQSKKFS